MFPRGIWSQVDWKIEGFNWSMLMLQRNRAGRISVLFFRAQLGHFVVNVKLVG